MGARRRCRGERGSEEEEVDDEQPCCLSIKRPRGGSKCPMTDELAQYKRTAAAAAAAENCSDVIVLSV